MYACVDVSYHADEAVAACVLFRSWTDATGVSQIVENFGKVEVYHPGEFYRRELPPLLAVLRKVRGDVEVVLVDGYVWLAEGKPGLGARLYEELGRSTAVIGVAKSRFVGAEQAIVLLRGRSKRPLYITAAGMDAETAARCVLMMHGPDRIPTLLKFADRLARQGLKPEHSLCD